MSKEEREAVVASMTKEERDTLIAGYLNTPIGKLRFAKAFYQGVNKVLMISDDIGDLIIQEFQEQYGTTRGLMDYLEEVSLHEPINRKPTIH